MRGSNENQECRISFVLADDQLVATKPKSNKEPKFSAEYSIRLTPHRIICGSSWECPEKCHNTFFSSSSIPVHLYTEPFVLYFLPVPYLIYKKKKETNELRVLIELTPVNFGGEKICELEWQSSNRCLPLTRSHP